MDNSAAALNQQDNNDSHDSSENTTDSAPQPQQQSGVDHNDENSEWETESDGEDGDEDEDDVSDDDDDDDDDGDMGSDIGFDDPEMLLDDILFFTNNHPASLFDIEKITSAVRANRRPHLDEDEDIMSDFSGDEKYELQENPSDEPGKGDQDMVDISPLEPVRNRLDNGQLTYKIRQLMLRLTKGRRNRERKLRIDNSNIGASTSSSSSSTSAQGAYLHRLIVRGPDTPQELEHSPALTFHRQCANSLCVTPSSMGVMDDVFTIHSGAVMRCGVLDRMNEQLYHSRRGHGISDYEYDAYDTTDGVHEPYAKKLKTVKATKFLKDSLYQFDLLPTSEQYITLDDMTSNPICMAHRYGYLALGFANGELEVYCTAVNSRPEEISHEFSDDDRFELPILNSVQIVRWPRYYRNKAMTGDGEQYDEMENDDEEYDGKDGYPSKTGQFDHYLLMTGNESGLFIVGLPDHPDEETLDEQLSQYSGGGEMEHIFRNKKDNTWIRNGFKGELLNDAKTSPNGRWIAVVGDSSRVWTVEVTHVPETEEQRLARHKREQEAMNDSDSEYLTEDSIDPDDEDYEDEDMDHDSGDNKAWRNRKRSGSVSSDEDQSPRRPRLLRQFGEPVPMTIPSHIIYPPYEKRGQRLNRPYTSQYVAWNSTSTKFAHSSDVFSRVMVWSMPSREVVCCVDTGGTSLGIEFHPKLENLFSVFNWYGFVHIVDITGCCVGDEDLIPDSGKAKEGPGITRCEGPHYEEKHDILMLSFRGEKDKSLRILDGIRGMGWSTDGRYLYVATLRRVLRYELAAENFRIPSLFEQCAQKVREWKERIVDRDFTGERLEDIRKEFTPMDKEWEYVPYSIKRRIWGDVFSMRSHVQ
ncbi:hypothetical protein BGZ46_000268 [Entomortierella lignicola]|nr:hypothetical protein BGZ46_000268 [Entomortierella lignicola]